MLTRSDILALSDITVKEITCPDTIPVWGGRSLFIQQLTRGQQDLYLKRQFGAASLKQDRRATQQEVTGMNFYGNDAWLCCQAITDANGIRLFTDADEAALAKKSGEAIGWIAKEILLFSNMQEDADQAAAEGARTTKEKMADDIKN